MQLLKIPSRRKLLRWVWAISECLREHIVQRLQVESIYLTTFQLLHRRALLRSFGGLLENEIQRLCRRGIQLFRMAGYLEDTAPIVLIVWLETQAPRLLQPLHGSPSPT
jgi:hypothetical protein